MNKPDLISTGKLSAALKPRYRDISALVGENYDAPNGIDIYLDFNTLITAISGCKAYLGQIPFVGEKEIELDLISTVISTYHHWKNFTRKWGGDMKNDGVRIIGIVNDLEVGKLAESSYLKSYLMQYNYKFKNERFKQFVYYWNQTVKTIETILKYVPGMYFVHCNKFDSYVLPDILTDYKGTQVERLIITGNSLMTNYQFEERTKVIYSNFAGKKLARFTDPIMIVQSITHIHEDIMGEFIKNKICYNLMNAIVGDFERGIIGLPQTSIMNVACSLLRCIEQHKIPQNPKSVESVLPAIDSLYHDYVKQTYPLVDIESHSQMVPQSSIETIKSQMIDLYDIDGLSAIRIDGMNLLELL